MRSEKLFNDNWEFLLTPFGTALKDLKSDALWQKISLPHDWLIYDTGDLYADGTGWYRKTFMHEKKPERRYLLNFDGIYMDSVIYVNGKEAGHNHYGYSSFELDITDLLDDGENTVMVSVGHKSPNSRWYSGAGIFRDVIFKDVPEIHIVTNGIYISTRKENGRWTVNADTEICGSGRLDLGFDISLLPASPDNSRCIVKPCREAADFVIDDSSNGDNCAVCSHPCGMRGEVRVSGVETHPSELTQSALSAGATSEFSTVFSIDNPFVWDITSPNLYELRVTLSCERNGVMEPVDEYAVRFGLREVRFTTDRGMILNGRRVKLNGVCEHHDLGCLGAAFHKDAFRRKIIKLKEMGVNAIRTSHNMPARGLVELADEMGILLDSEAFDMWRRAKTEFDYARFFDEDYEKDIASWVRRDRSNPSVIMWSVGNEIYDCHADESAQDLVRSLKANVEKHDYRKNGLATFASNYMPWEGAQKCADILKLAGYNYAERLYDDHHRKYPDWMIYGSETCSTVQSRGIYHFPMKVSVMADDDEQCSALGNSTTSWGAENVEYTIKAERDHEFSAGQFLWSGFDYIGEPTPYHTKNSYFGQIDTAGFPKDTFYIFKGSWTDVKKAPFVHVFPYWDFNEGQIIDVRIASNAPCTELIVNGVSHGRKYVDHDKDAVLCPVWQVPYHKGYIEAIAYDADGNEIARQRRSSFGDVDELRYDKTVYNDLVFFEIYAVDKEGNEVENANCRVNVRITGGRLLGLDNGDSTDFDQYKCDSRRMFVGRLLAVAAPDAGKNASDVGIELEPDRKDIPIRKIEISSCEAHFTAGHPCETVEARIYPENATFDDITWAVVNEYAVKSNKARIEVSEDSASGNVRTAKLTAKGDGEFRLRCMTHNGTEKMQCISTLEFSAEGLGTAYLDPYDFIAGSLYTDHKGDVGNGNEKGVATPRGAESYIGYENIDFGDFGSDEITIPIFTLSGDEYHIGIWDGRPGEEGSELLLDGIYRKPSIWNVYQPETYKLKKRLKGIKNLYFTANDKFHIKGFSFAKPDKAFSTVYAAENTRIYGDTFTVGDEAVTGIGNNVTIEFDDMIFDGRRAKKLVICGLSRAENNSIHLKTTSRSGASEKTLLEFKHTDDYEEKCFDIVPDLSDCVKIEFVFLPGSNFDMKYFRFEM